MITFKEGCDKFNQFRMFGLQYQNITAWKKSHNFKRIVKNLFIIKTYMIQISPLQLLTYQKNNNNKQ